MTPQRLQRSRARGYRMPAGAVYVGRPTKWGNPYRPGELITPDHPGWAAACDRAPIRHGAMLDFTLERVETCVHAYRDWLHRTVGTSRFALAVEARAELAAHDLVCWCPLDQPCHADVLLEVANG